MDAKIRIEESDEYVEIERDGDLVGIESGYPNSFTRADLSVEKTMELYRALGQILDVNND